MTESFEIVETTSLEIIDTAPSSENISLFKATFQNFHKICRFCLGSDNLKPFFDMTYNKVSVQSIIYDCCLLQVNPEDCLPCNLCETCITELIRFYKFKTRCIQVTGVLQDAYDNRNFTGGNEETIQSYDENEVNLIIKREEIEDPLSICNDSTFEDLTTIHNEIIFTDNVIIKNEAFQNMVETYKVNFSRDFNCDNLDENKVIVNPVTICNDGYDDKVLDGEIVKVVSSNNLQRNEMVQGKEDRGTPNCKTTVIAPHSRSVCRKSANKKWKPKRNIGKTPHKCSICKETFVQRSDLCKHMLLHKDEKPHKCSVCEKSFTQKSHLNVHMLLHADERPHKCNVCNQSFRHRGSLKTHMLVHNGEKPHNCSVCKKSFTQKSNLKSHMLCHTGESPHQCNVCKKSFTQKSYLNTHMLIHTGERPHKCNVCNQSFTVKYTLKTHMLRHADEKPYKCTVCERCFNYKSNLMTHMLYHEGEKPHKCNVCEKSFTVKTHLSRHMLIHTGEKSHKCNVCNRSFTMKYNLDAHVLRHAGKT